EAVIRREPVEAEVELEEAQPVGVVDQAALRRPGRTGGVVDVRDRLRVNAHRIEGERLVLRAVAREALGLGIADYHHLLARRDGLLAHSYQASGATFVFCGHSRSWVKISSASWRRSRARILCQLATIASGLQTIAGRTLSSMFRGR